MVTSGIPWIAWLLNRSLDTEGGDFHEFYLRSAQISTYVTPALLIMMFARLYNAFNRTIAIDTTEYSIYCGNSLCTQGRNFYNYAYIPGDSDFTVTNANKNFEVRIADNTQLNHIALFFFSTIFSIAVSQRTLKSIKADFDQAVLYADMYDMMYDIGDEMPVADESASTSEPASQW